jgi:four helix bundle protein
MQAGFEQLRIWKEAHRLMLEVHRLAVTFPDQERFRLRDQIERSSSSVPDNIAEGYSSYYYNDKIKGMYVARKEAGETQNHIRSAQSKTYVGTREAESFVEKYEGLIRSINAYVKYLCSKRDRSK